MSGYKQKGFCRNSKNCSAEQVISSKTEQSQQTNTLGQVSSSQTETLQVSSSDQNNPNSVQIEESKTTISSKNMWVEPKIHPAAFEEQYDLILMDLPNIIHPLVKKYKPTDTPQNEEQEQEKMSTVLIKVAEELIQLLSQIKLKSNGKIIIAQDGIVSLARINSRIYIPNDLKKSKTPDYRIDGGKLTYGTKYWNQFEKLFQCQLASKLPNLNSVIWDSGLQEGEADFKIITYLKIIPPSLETCRALIISEDGDYKFQMLDEEIKSNTIIEQYYHQNKTIADLSQFKTELLTTSSGQRVSKNVVTSLQLLTLMFEKAYFPKIIIENELKEWLAIIVQTQTELVKGTQIQWETLNEFFLKYSKCNHAQCQNQQPKIKHFSYILQGLQIGIVEFVTRQINWTWTWPFERDLNLSLAEFLSYLQLSKFQNGQEIFVEDGSNHPWKSVLQKQIYKFGQDWSHVLTPDRDKLDLYYNSFEYQQYLLLRQTGIDKYCQTMLIEKILSLFPVEDVYTTEDKPLDNLSSLDRISLA